MCKFYTPENLTFASIHSTGYYGGVFLLISARKRDPQQEDTTIISCTVDRRNTAPNGSHGKPMFVGSYRGIIIRGLLGWCEINGFRPSTVSCSQGDKTHQSRPAHCFRVASPRAGADAYRRPGFGARRGAETKVAFCSPAKRSTFSG